MNNCKENSLSRTKIKSKCRRELENTNLKEFSRLQILTICLNRILIKVPSQRIPINTILTTESLLVTKAMFYTNNIRILVITQALVTIETTVTTGIQEILETIETNDLKEMIKILDI
jgi:hypothetical protein